jgi:hypothetical protein
MYIKTFVSASYPKYLFRKWNTMFSAKANNLAMGFQALM